MGEGAVTYNSPHDEHVVALDATLVWSPAPVSWDEREEGGYVG